MSEIAETTESAAPPAPERRLRYDFNEEEIALIRSCGRDPHEPDLRDVQPILNGLGQSELEGLRPAVEHSGRARHHYRGFVAATTLYGPEVFRASFDKYMEHVAKTLAPAKNEPPYVFALPWKRLEDLAALNCGWRRDDLQAPVERDRQKVSVYLPGFYRESLRRLRFETRRSYSALAEEAFADLIAKLSAPPATKRERVKE
jgi:hypothetical protein